MKHKRFCLYTAALCIAVLLAVPPAFAETAELPTVYKRDFVEIYNSGNTDYSADGDGWTTFCYRSCGNESGAEIPDRKMKMINRSGSIFFGGGGDNYRNPDAIAIFNRELSSEGSVRGLNSGRNLSLDLWFHSRFNGITPFSGFCFRYWYDSKYDDNKKIYAGLFYRQKPGVQYTLYTKEIANADETANAVFGKTSAVEYDLEFGGGKAQLTLTNRGGDGVTGSSFSTGKIDLCEKLSEVGVNNFEERGLFAFDADVGYGYLGMKNIEIETEADEISAEDNSIMVSDGRVLAAAEYISCGTEGADAVAAVFDGDGMLIAAQPKHGDSPRGRIEFSVDIPGGSAPASVRFFLLGKASSQIYELK